MADESAPAAMTGAGPGRDDILVRVENLVKYFPVRPAGDVHPPSARCTRSTGCRW